jgi:hypothetical protein
MERNSMGGRLARAAVLLAAMGTAGAAALPESIGKLAGSSEDVAKSVMSQNGYAERGEKSSWGRRQTFWWSDRARQCVELTTMANRVLYVEAKGPSDCVATAAGSAAGALIDPQFLVGLPRKAAEARLTAAGFNALSIDESKVDATYVWWFNGRQCLAGTIIGDRYDMLTSMPLKNCTR